jgi:hypothetical protein
MIKPASESEEKDLQEALECAAIEIEKPSKKLLADLTQASANTFKKKIVESTSV